MLAADRSLTDDRTSRRQHAPGFTPRFVKNNSSGNSKQYYQESDNDSDGMSDEFASYIQMANTKAEEKQLQQKRCATIVPGS